jgi:Ca-activated chloride channel family protein
MRFAVPPGEFIVWLLALPTLAAVVFAVAFLRRREAARRAFAEPALMRRIALGASHERQRLKTWLAVVAVVALGVAAGRPQIGTKLGVVKRQGIDLMIALDTSASMEARDLKPDRLEKAKREAGSLVNLLDGDRVGIITFSGTAFVQCPLTVDYGAASMLLSTVKPGIIPTPGTAIGEAIRLAVKSMATQPDRAKVLVLLTDGEDHGSDPVGAAKEAAKAGLRIYTIGLGGTAGEPIPLAAEEGSGYKRDKSGEVVMSRLDEGTLMDVAAETGGRYFRATDGERELTVIEEEISKMQQGELESKMFAYYEERFQYPLAFALAAMLLGSFLPDRVRRRRNGEE